MVTNILDGLSRLLEELLSRSSYDKSVWANQWNLDTTSTESDSGPSLSPLSVQQFSQFSHVTSGSVYLAELQLELAQAYFAADRKEEAKKMAQNALSSAINGESELIDEFIANNPESVPTSQIQTEEKEEKGKKKAPTSATGKRGKTETQQVKSTPAQESAFSGIDDLVPPFLHPESEQRTSTRCALIISLIDQPHFTLHSTQSQPQSSPPPTKAAAPKGGEKGAAKQTDTNFPKNTHFNKDQAIYVDLRRRLQQIFCGDPSLASSVSAAYESVWQIVSEAGLPASVLTAMRQSETLRTKEAPLQQPPSNFAPAEMENIPGFRAGENEQTEKEPKKGTKEKERPKSSTKKPAKDKEPVLETSEEPMVIPTSSLFVTKNHSRAVFWTIVVECAKAFEFLGYPASAQILSDCLLHSTGVPQHTKIALAYINQISKLRVFGDRCDRLDDDVIEARLAILKVLQSNVRTALRIDLNFGQVRLVEEGCRFMYDVAYPLLLTSTRHLVSSALHFAYQSLETVGSQQLSLLTPLKLHAGLCDLDQDLLPSAQSLLQSVFDSDYEAREKGHRTFDLIIEPLLEELKIRLAPPATQRSHLEQATVILSHASQSQSLEPLLQRALTELDKAENGSDGEQPEITVIREENEDDETRAHNDRVVGLRLVSLVKLWHQLMKTAWKNRLVKISEKAADSIIRICLVILNLRNPHLFGTASDEPRPTTANPVKEEKGKKGKAKVEKVEEEVKEETPTLPLNPIVKDNLDSILRWIVAAYYTRGETIIAQKERTFEEDEGYLPLSVQKELKEKSEGKTPQPEEPRLVLSPFVFIAKGIAIAAAMKDVSLVMNGVVSLTNYAKQSLIEHSSFHLQLPLRIALRCLAGIVGGDALFQLVNIKLGPIPSLTEGAAPAVETKPAKGAKAEKAAGKAVTPKTKARAAKEEKKEEPASEAEEVQPEVPPRPWSWQEEALALSEDQLPASISPPPSLAGKVGSNPYAPERLSALVRLAEMLTETEVLSYLWRKIPEQMKQLYKEMHVEFPACFTAVQRKDMEKKQRRKEERRAKRAAREEERIRKQHEEELKALEIPDEEEETEEQKAARLFAEDEERRRKEEEEEAERLRIEEEEKAAAALKKKGGKKPKSAEKKVKPTTKKEEAKKEEEKVEEQPEGGEEKKEEEENLDSSDEEVVEGIEAEESEDDQLKQKSDADLPFPHTLLIQRAFSLLPPSLQTPDAECPELINAITAADQVINFCLLPDTQLYAFPIERVHTLQRLARLRTDAHWLKSGTVLSNPYPPPPPPKNKDGTEEPPPAQPEKPQEPSVSDTTNAFTASTTLPNALLSSYAAVELLQIKAIPHRNNLIPIATNIAAKANSVEVWAGISEAALETKMFRCAQQCGENGIRTCEWQRMHERNPSPSDDVPTALAATEDPPSRPQSKSETKKPAKGKKGAEGGEPEASSDDPEVVPPPIFPPPKESHLLSDSRCFIESMVVCFTSLGIAITERMKQSESIDPHHASSLLQSASSCLVRAVALCTLVQNYRQALFAGRALHDACSVARSMGLSAETLLNSSPITVSVFEKRPHLFGGGIIGNVIGFFEVLRCLALFSIKGKVKQQSVSKWNEYMTAFAEEIQREDCWWTDKMIETGDPQVDLLRSSIQSFSTLKSNQTSASRKSMNQQKILFSPPSFSKDLNEAFASELTQEDLESLTTLSNFCCNQLKVLKSDDVIVPALVFTSTVQQILPQSSIVQAIVARVFFLGKNRQSADTELANILSCTPHIQSTIYLELAEAAETSSEREAMYKNALPLVKGDLQQVEAMINYSSWLASVNRTEEAESQLKDAFTTIVNYGHPAPPSHQQQQFSESGRLTSRMATVRSASHTPRVTPTPTDGRISSLTVRSQQTEATNRLDRSGRINTQTPFEAISMNTNRTGFTSLGTFRTDESSGRGAHSFLVNNQKSKKTDIRHFEALMRVHVMSADIAANEQEALEKTFEALTIVLQILEMATGYANAKVARKQFVEMRKQSMFEKKAEEEKTTIEIAKENQEGVQQQEAVQNKKRMMSIHPKFVLPQTHEAWLLFDPTVDYINAVYSLPSGKGINNGSFTHPEKTVFFLGMIIDRLTAMNASCLTGPVFTLAELVTDLCVHTRVSGNTATRDSIWRKFASHSTPDPALLLSLRLKRLSVIGSLFPVHLSSIVLQFPFPQTARSLPLFVLSSPVGSSINQVDFFKQLGFDLQPRTGNVNENQMTFPSPLASLSPESLPKLLQQYSPQTIEILSKIADKSNGVDLFPSTSGLNLSYLISSAETFLQTAIESRERALNLTSADSGRFYNPTIKESILSSASGRTIPINKNNLAATNICEVFASIAASFLDLGLHYHSQLFFSEALVRADTSPDFSLVSFRSHIGLATLLYIQGRDEEGLEHIRQCTNYSVMPMDWIHLVRFFLWLSSGVTFVSVGYDAQGPIRLPARTLAPSFLKSLDQVTQKLINPLSSHTPHALVLQAFKMAAEASWLTVDLSRMSLLHVPTRIQYENVLTLLAEATVVLSGSSNSVLLIHLLMFRCWLVLQRMILCHERIGTSSEAGMAAMRSSQDSQNPTRNSRMVHRESFEIWQTSVLESMKLAEQADETCEVALSSILYLSDGEDVHSIVASIEERKISLQDEDPSLKTEQPVEEVKAEETAPPAPAGKKGAKGKDATKEKPLSREKSVRGSKDLSKETTPAVQPAETKQTAFFNDAGAIEDSSTLIALSLTSINPIKQLIAAISLLKSFLEIELARQIQFRCFATEEDEGEESTLSSASASRSNLNAPSDSESLASTDDIDDMVNVKQELPDATTELPPSNYNLVPRYDSQKGVVSIDFPLMEGKDPSAVESYLVNEEEDDDKPDVLRDDYAAATPTPIEPTASPQKDLVQNWRAHSKTALELCTRASNLCPDNIVIQTEAALLKSFALSLITQSEMEQAPYVVHETSEDNEHFDFFALRKKQQLQQMRTEGSVRQTFKDRSLSWKEVLESFHQAALAEERKRIEDLIEKQRLEDEAAAAAAEKGAKKGKKADDAPVEKKKGKAAAEPVEVEQEAAPIVRPTPPSPFLSQPLPSTFRPQFPHFTLASFSLPPSLPTVPFTDVFVELFKSMSLASDLSHTDVLTKSARFLSRLYQWSTQSGLLLPFIPPSPTQTLPFDSFTRLPLDVHQPTQITPASPMSTNVVDDFVLLNKPREPSFPPHDVDSIPGPLHVQEEEAASIRTFVSDAFTDTYLLLTADPALVTEREKTLGTDEEPEEGKKAKAKKPQSATGTKKKEKEEEVEEVESQTGYSKEYEFIVKQSSSYLCSLLSKSFVSPSSFVGLIGGIKNLYSLTPTPSSDRNEAPTTELFTSSVPVLTGQPQNEEVQVETDAKKKKKGEAKEEAPVQEGEEKAAQVAPLSLSLALNFKIRSPSPLVSFLSPLLHNVSVSFSSENFEPFLSQPISLAALPLSSALPNWLYSPWVGSFLAAYAPLTRIARRSNRRSNERRNRGAQPLNEIKAGIQTLLTAGLGLPHHSQVLFTLGLAFKQQKINDFEEPVPPTPSEVADSETEQIQSHEENTTDGQPQVTEDGEEVPAELVIPPTPAIEALLEVPLPTTTYPISIHTPPSPVPLMIPDKAMNEGPNPLEVEPSHPQWHASDSRASTLVTNAVSKITSVLGGGRSLLAQTLNQIEALSIQQNLDFRSLLFGSNGEVHSGTFGATSLSPMLFSSAASSVSGVARSVSGLSLTTCPSSSAISASTLGSFVSPGSSPFSVSPAGLLDSVLPTNHPTVISRRNRAWSATISSATTILSAPSETRTEEEGGKKGKGKSEATEKAPATGTSSTARICSYKDESEVLGESVVEQMVSMRGITLPDILSKLPQETIVMILSYDYEKGDVVVGVVASPLPFVPSAPLAKFNPPQPEEPEKPVKGAKPTTPKQASKKKGAKVEEVVQDQPDDESQGVQSIRTPEPKRPKTLPIANTPPSLPIEHTFIEARLERTAVSLSQIHSLAAEFAEWNKERNNYLATTHDDIINSEHNEWNEDQVGSSANHRHQHRQQAKAVELRMHFTALITKLENIFGKVFARALRTLLSIDFPRPILISADVLFHSFPMESLSVLNPPLIPVTIPPTEEEEEPTTRLVSPIRSISRDFSLFLTYHRIVMWENSNATQSEAPKPFAIIADPADEDLPRVEMDPQRGVCVRGEEGGQPRRSQVSGLFTPFVRPPESAPESESSSRISTPQKGRKVKTADKTTKGKKEDPKETKKGKKVEEAVPMVDDPLHSMPLQRAALKEIEDPLEISQYSPTVMESRIRYNRQTGVVLQDAQFATVDAGRVNGDHVLLVTPYRVHSGQPAKADDDNVRTSQAPKTPATKGKRTTGKKAAAAKADSEDEQPEPLPQSSNKLLSISTDRKVMPPLTSSSIRQVAQNTSALVLLQTGRFFDHMPVGDLFAQPSFGPRFVMSLTQSETKQSLSRRASNDARTDSIQQIPVIKTLNSSPFSAALLSLTGIGGVAVNLFSCLPSDQLSIAGDVLSDSERGVAFSEAIFNANHQLAVKETLSAGLPKNKGGRDRSRKGRGHGREADSHTSSEPILPSMRLFEDVSVLNSLGMCYYGIPQLHLPPQPE
ncbi:hypothetical protein BLNAU_3635 [Blattamonas nauphoetae]|uniref:Uncharacterized protein n=1 Tax=Blattamonas nauphoetae TaxID=2049346 RepID=A0ABQ9YCM2_9EUKA|nr:hypothetical protein BLNAU_3635 [Blattamonas nauphoetae]